VVPLSRSGGWGGCVAPWLTSARPGGVPWQAVPLHWGLRRRLPHLLRLWYRLRQAQPTVLLSYTKVPNLAAALLWRVCGVRLCIWNQADAGLLLAPGLLHRLAIHQSTHFIVNAEGGRRFLQDTFGLQPQQLQLIRNGIRLEDPRADRRTWRERLGVAEGICIAVMVANLSSYKDHDTLLQAWRLVLDRWSGSAAGDWFLRDGLMTGPKHYSGKPPSWELPGRYVSSAGWQMSADFWQHQSCVCIALPAKAYPMPYWRQWLPG